MIKNVIFDFGNVLVDYRLKEFLADKGFDEIMIKRILKASIMSPYWEQFERNELTVDEVFKAFVSMDPEIEAEIYKAYDNIKGMLTIRDFATGWIMGLNKAGYGTYYLSNYSSKAYYECSDSIAFIEHMNGGLVSFKVGMTKPDPNMYNRLLEEYKLTPEECVFIDDTEENVVVARELGFKAIVFESYESTVKQLADMGVEI